MAPSLLQYKKRWTSKYVLLGDRGYEEYATRRDVREVDGRVRIGGVLRQQEDETSGAIQCVDLAACSTSSSLLFHQPGNRSRPTRDKYFSRTSFSTK